MNNLKLTLIATFIILVFAFSLLYSSDINENAPKKIPIVTGLKTGPIKSQLPLFKNIKNINGEEYNLEDMLKFEQMNVNGWWPEKGDRLSWDSSTIFKWTVSSADTSGFVLYPDADKKVPQIIYLATYIDARRWVKAELEVFSYHIFQVYLDGKIIASKTSSEKVKNDTVKVEPGKVVKDLELETGKHLLLVKLLWDPENDAAWNVKAELQIAKEFDENDLVISTSPKHSMNIKHLLDGPKVTSASISPDGQWVTVSISQASTSGEEPESWLELRQVRDGKLIQEFRGGMKLNDIQWAPKGKKFSYTSSSKDGSTLWIVDFIKGNTTPLLKDIKDLTSHTWSPDGSFIIYSVSEKPEPEKSGIRKLNGMPDRWPTWRDRDFLYFVNVPEGTRRRLTAGKLTTDINSISPDGKRLIFNRSVVDFNNRPYSKSEVFSLDLNTMELDSIYTGNWFRSVQWSPDGKKLLFTGTPSMFGEIGINVSEGTIPNESDTQAYIYNLATKNIEPITLYFNPQVNQASWSNTENCIYFNTMDRSYRHLYRYDLKTKKFELIDTGVEAMKEIDIALNSSKAVYIGSSASVHAKAYVLDLAKKKYRVLADPSKKDFEDVVLNKVERWTFENTQGTEIEGRIYYPPNFDLNRKYPCIVYYYGGTSPVTREFGGRYPKNLYAAQGYVVYVLQPSGATGFGQKFSALHVNDWGIIVADEIIDGVKKFLAAHPFVDEKRVGCIGASYGGFMTMLLQTRTDMFSAAVSHAGISSLSSYWGEGYWGYLYSAVATANSFPWNRKDIYIEQSPLFSADKIKTPLLLLHGMGDTNVPPGESIQLYTALKLLGREVELIQVSEQDHWILDYNKRIKWMKSILAWFDKWLKDEPNWWDNLYQGE